MQGNVPRNWVVPLLKVLADILFCNALLWLAWSEQILQVYVKQPLYLPFGPWMLWKALGTLERLPTFSIFQRLRSERRHYQTMWVFADLCFFNLLGFSLLKAAIFYLGGMTDLWTLCTFMIAFALYLWAAHGVEPWTQRPSLRNLLLQGLGILYKPARPVNQTLNFTFEVA